MEARSLKVIHLTSSWVMTVMGRLHYACNPRSTYTVCSKYLKNLIIPTDIMVNLTCSPGSIIKFWFPIIFSQLLSYSSFWLVVTPCGNVYQVKNEESIPTTLFNCRMSLQFYTSGPVYFRLKVSGYCCASGMLIMCCPLKFKLKSLAWLILYAFFIC